MPDSKDVKTRKKCFLPQEPMVRGEDRQADTHTHTHTQQWQGIVYRGRRVDVMDRIRIIHRLGRSGGR